MYKGKRPGYLSSKRERGNILFLTFFVLFGSLRDWLVPMHICASLFSLLILMLISSGNLLTDTPRKNVLSDIRASLSLIRLTRKI